MRKFTFAWLLLIVAAFSLQSAEALALDKYITPTGAGSQDGSSWANAYPGNTGSVWETAENAVTAAGSGHVYVEKGDYGPFTANLVLFSSPGGSGIGSEVEIRCVNAGTTTDVSGTDYCKLTGNWLLATYSSGAKAFELANGADNIKVYGFYTESWNKHYDARNYENNNITIQHFKAINGQDGIWLRGLSTVTGATPDTGASNNWTISDGYINGFTKRGIRGSHGTYDVELTDVEVDMGGVTYDKENFMIGIEVGNGSGIDTADHNWTLTRVTARNSYDNNAANYWNADGLSLEDNTYNMVFRFVKGFNNTDGGIDIKWNSTHGSAPIFEDCVFMNNGRGMRFWGDNGGSEAATITRTISAFSQYWGGSSSPTNLWTQGNLTISNSTFHSVDGGYNITLNDDSGATPDVTISSSIVSFLSSDTGSTMVNYLAGTINGVSGSSNLNANGTVVYDPGDLDPAWPTGTNPQYSNEDDTAFEGDSNSFNPAAYLSGGTYTKGYYNGTSLTALNFEPASLLTNAVGNATVSFTITTALPSDGKIEITLPTSLGSGFSWSSGGTTTAAGLSGIDGTLSFSAASNVGTFTRGGGATQTSADTVISFTVSNILNPNTAGATGTYTFRTLDSSSNLIDSGSADSDTISNPPSGATPIVIAGATLSNLTIS